MVNQKYLILAVFICLLIFLADIQSYLDFWILYVFPIVIVLRTQSVAALYIILGLSALFVGLGLFVSPTGVPFIVELENRILGFSSEIIFVIIVGSLIKTRRQLERESEDLKRRTKELADSNKELEAFSYSVSHDLRSPIRAIKGFSEFLKEDYASDLDETARDYLDRIIAGAEHANSLIDDMLLLSKVSRQELQLTTLDLSHIVKHLAEDLKKNDPDRDITFKIEKELIVRGDEKLLTIALTNLIGNAWKYTAKKEHALIEFGKQMQTEETVFFVKDNGAGFDMKYTDKLFEPFQRLHSEKEFGGTGVGLATVERVIRKHGGKVWGEGKPGEGATFYFTLPETGSE